MPKVRFIGNVKSNGVLHLKGTIFEGEQDFVDELVRLGAAVDPKTVDEVTGVSQADAEAEAAATKAKAEEEAKKTLKAAQDEAAKVVADAKAEAKKLTDAAKDQNKK